MKSETRDFAFLHFLVLIWGFTAILGVLIDLPSVEMVFFRTLLASIGLLPIIIFGKKRFSFQRNSDLVLSLATGALIAAHWILFFLAARISTISVCLAGMATCSLWTSFMEPLANRRKIKGYEVLLSVIGFLGIVVIFNVEIDHYVGLLVAMLSAAFAAWFTVINGKLTQREDPFVITFYEMLGACFSITLFLPIYVRMEGIGSLSLSPSWNDWGYLLILSLVCTVYAYSYSVELMKRLSAFSVNLTVNLEPVYGITLALIFFPEKEQMTSGFYWGTALILSSVLIYPLLNRMFKRKALRTDNLR